MAKTLETSETLLFETNNADFVKINHSLVTLWLIFRFGQAGGQNGDFLNNNDSSIFVLETEKCSRKDFENFKAYQLTNVTSNSIASRSVKVYMPFNIHVTKAHKDE